MLGFALGERRDARLAYSALVMAVTVRGGQVPDVILHTDRGSEYTAAWSAGLPAAVHLPADGPARLRPARLRASHRGERSWRSTLEFELRALERFTTREAARARVSAWIAAVLVSTFRASAGYLPERPPGRYTPVLQIHRFQALLQFGLLLFNELQLTAP